MELNFEEHIVERAVLVGLNADCFKLHETATEETLEELEALLETAVGHCHHSAVWLRKAVRPLLSGTGALSIPFTLSPL